jgi:1,4-dihydroxy-2-naphthoate polyprenyltransferase
MIQLFKVARPQFIISGLALFIFGASWAVLLGAPFSLSRALLGYLVLLPAHLSVSYSNDFFDVEVDKFDKHTFFSGGSGVLVDHPELRTPAKWTAIFLILLSLALGIVFQIVFAFPIWFIGLIALGNLLGWFYSAPPLKLAYRGLGELAMVLCVGLLIPGFGYLVTVGPVNPDTFIFCAPLILYGLAFILSVEIPDMEPDRLGNKWTWITRKGRSFGFIMIGISLFLATAFFFCIPLLTLKSYPLDFRFLGFVSLLPLGAGCVGLLKRPVEKRSAITVVNGILVTFGIFCILADGYMIFLCLSRMA